MRNPRNSLKNSTFDSLISLFQLINFKIVSKIIQKVNETVARFAEFGVVVCGKLVGLKDGVELGSGGGKKVVDSVELPGVVLIGGGIRTVVVVLLVVVVVLRVVVVVRRVVVLLVVTRNLSKIAL
jgi:hypothetical protein